MSTIATISVKLDGNPSVYKTITCHYDGDPTGVGAMLENYYNTFKKAINLISLGDISSLGEKVEPDMFSNKPHTIHKPQPGVTVAYGRDAGEDDTQARIFYSLREILDYKCWYEFAYVFENKKWYLLCETKSLEPQLKPLYNILGY